ncbi:hypothetical protein [Antribacter gilvus]|uniref:hypothetical protein n=1 Tax=Antribacter gilvus TaxID=2304675 RepID=UPI000F7871D9|nr:hypothetical protein [Antribacter gilvus]
MTIAPEKFHAPATGARRGTHRLAHVVALLTLPSGLWRIALVAGLPVVSAAIVLPLGERIYIVSLSLVSEAVALLALGLVQHWGEVAPRWLPIIGGRPVHRLAATIPAALGSAALTGIWTFAAIGLANGFANGTLYEFFPTDAQRTILVLCYAPLLAWGPLLGVLTVAYFRRRRTS